MKRRENLSFKKVRQYAVEYSLNILISESRTSDKLVQALESIKVKCGVYNRFYYGDLVGADARRLTEPDNSRALWSLIECDEVILLHFQYFD